MTRLFKGLIKTHENHASKNLLRFFFQNPETLASSLKPEIFMKKPRSLKKNKNQQSSNQNCEK